MHETKWKGSEGMGAEGMGGKGMGVEWRGGVEWGWTGRGGVVKLSFNFQKPGRSRVIQANKHINAKHGVHTIPF